MPPTALSASRTGLQLKMQMQIEKLKMENSLIFCLPTAHCSLPTLFCYYSEKQF